MKKIVVIGPESTGKSTLTQQLAQHFECPSVQEYAREYIDRLERPYVQDDLLAIARGQLVLEDKLSQTNSAYLFCDTDLRVINIWSIIKYGQTDPWITNQIQQRTYHGYLLMNVDLPWKNDPQREHEHRLEELFDMYHKDLSHSGVPYSIISGQGKERFQSAIDFILSLD